jgi:hypothetical protein
MQFPKLRTIVAATALAGGLGGATAAVALTNSATPVAEIQSVSVTRGSVDDHGTGRCQEPEHKNDPGCTGATSTTVKVEDNSAATAPAATPVATAAKPAPAPATAPAAAPTPAKADDDDATEVENASDDDATEVDDHGTDHCQEPEHKNEPRCTGTPASASGTPVSDSGRGRGSDDKPSSDDKSGRGRGRGSDG